MTEKIVTVDGDVVELELERDGNRFRAGEHAIELVATRGDEAELRVDGRSYLVPFIIEGTRIWFSFDGETYAADVTDKGARVRARHRDHSASAPMPGVVLKILVALNDVVSKGAPLIILEAMKMEHQIVAPYDGTVTAIHCKEGEMVQPGVELIDVKRAQTQNSS